MTVRIDLAGPEGNGMALIARAVDFGRQLDYSREEITRITSAMRSGSYADMLNTLEREFPGVEFEFKNDPRTKGKSK